MWGGRVVEAERPLAASEFDLLAALARSQERAPGARLSAALGLAAVAAQGRHPWPSGSRVPWGVGWSGRHGGTGRWYPRDSISSARVSSPRLLPCGSVSDLADTMSGSSRLGTAIQPSRTAGDSVLLAVPA